MERIKSFEQNLTTIAAEFIENIKKYKETILVVHTDADGLSAASILKSMCERLHIVFRIIPNPLKEAWDQFLNKSLLNLKPPSGIIFADLCPSGKIISDFQKKFPDIDIYILDHHIFEPIKDNYPGIVYNGNPTLYGLNGLKQIAGSTLSYLFAKEVDEKNTNVGWMAAIGMGGDVLDHYENYQSYNKLVIDEAAELGIVEIKEGCCACGGMFETLEKGLPLSILPYLPQLKGDSTITKSFLQKIQLEPRQKIVDMSVDQYSLLAEKLHPRLLGKYITLPKKEGLFHFAFEHAHYISLAGYEKPLEMIQNFGIKSPTTDQKQIYITYIKEIVHNLTEFISIPKLETKYAILLDVSNRIPSKAWSDTASYASINQIYDSKKILFLGGFEENTMKLSMRCSSAFIDSHHNKGANTIAGLIKDKLGGAGGGHPLAAGLRIQPDQWKNLSLIIDSLVETL